MQNSQSSSQIISSGITHSIKEMAEIVFKYFDLNWENHIKIDKDLLRKVILLKLVVIQITYRRNWLETKVRFETQFTKF